jgi:hypothetical protein
MPYYEEDFPLNSERVLTLLFKKKIEKRKHHYEMRKLKMINLFRNLCVNKNSAIL